MRRGALLGLVLAVALFALLSNGTENASAQSQTLVSNLSQAVGSVGGSGFDHAQAFTTGGESGGYIITSVDAVLTSVTDTTLAAKFTVTIRSDSGGAPGTVVGTLINPSTPTTNADQTFNFAAPGSGIALAANTTYWLMFDRTAVITTPNFIRNAASGNEDSGGASGWSIADNSLYRALFTTGGWSTFNQPKKIRLNGDVKTPVTVTLVTNVNNGATEGSSEDSAAIILVLDRTLISGETVTVPLQFEGGTLNRDFRLHLNRPKFTHRHTCATFGEDTVCPEYQHGTPNNVEHHHDDAAGVSLRGQTVTFTGPTEIPGTLHYPAAGEGGTQVVISLTGNEDSDIEDESIRVSLGSLSSTGISGGVTGKRAGSGWYTIADNDKPPAAVTITETNGSTSVAENGGTDTYTVVLDSQPTNDVTVTVTSRNPGAVTVNKQGGTAGAAQTLTFTRSNWQTAQTITVTGVNDHSHNLGGSRSAIITHRTSSADSNYHSLTVDDVVVTVTDDDVAPTAIRLTVNDGSVAEGDGPQTIRVRAQVDGGSLFGTAQTVAVTVAGSGGQNVVGFTASPSSFDITINAGERNGERTFTLTPTDNSAEEEDETITVSGSLSGVTINPVEITLIDDDGGPRANFAAAASRAEEDGGTHTIRLILTPAPQTAVTVDYTVSGSAVSGADYTPLSGSVSVGSGGSADISVTITDDSEQEGPETVILTLNSGTGYNVGTANPVHALTITDNDATGPVLSITGGGTVTEGGNASFTITVNPAPSGSITVRYTVSQSGNFVTSTNRGSKTRSVSGTTAAFTIPTVDDSTDEPNGSVTVRLETDAGLHARHAERRDGHGPRQRQWRRRRRWFRWSIRFHQRRASACGGCPCNSHRRGKSARGRRRRRPLRGPRQ